MGARIRRSHRLDSARRGAAAAQRETRNEQPAGHRNVCACACAAAAPQSAVGAVSSRSEASACAQCMSRRCVQQTGGAAKNGAGAQGAAPSDAPTAAAEAAGGELAEEKLCACFCGEAAENAAADEEAGGRGDEDEEVEEEAAGGGFVGDAYDTASALHSPDPGDACACVCVALCRS